MVNLSYSIWWAWTDIAKAMSHLGIVGRYILLSHLQSHGEPICNVLLHGHLTCCTFGSVHLLACFFFLFFSKPSYSLQIRANTIQVGLNQSYNVFRGLEICLLPSSPRSLVFQNLWNCRNSHTSCPSVKFPSKHRESESSVYSWALEKHLQPTPSNMVLQVDTASSYYLTSNCSALRYTSYFSHISCYLPNSFAASYAISHFSSLLQNFHKVLCLEIAFCGSACRPSPCRLA